MANDKIKLYTTQNLIFFLFAMPIEWKYYLYTSDVKIW